jgi:hypothetical protein
MVKERLGSDCRRATPECKAAHCGSETSDGLCNEELTAFGKDEHLELRQPMAYGAGRCCKKCIKIRAIEGLGVVPVCHEKGTRDRKGTLSYPRRQIVV